MFILKVIIFHTETGGIVHINQFCQCTSKTNQAVNPLPSTCVPHYPSFTIRKQLQSNNALFLLSSESGLVFVVIYVIR